MNQYIIYDLSTGITLEIATTRDIQARLGDTRGYINLIEGFPPSLVGKTKVVAGEILPYEPEVSIEEKWLDLRLRRNRLLAASDWTQVADAPVDKEAWKAYRQLLRKFPSTIEDITQPIIWPKRPQ